MSLGLNFITKLMIVIVLSLCLTMSVDSNTHHRYCGEHLRQTLALYCNGLYNSYGFPAEKRTGEEVKEYEYINDEPLLPNSPLSYASYPILAQFSSAEALRPRIRRDTWLLRRGVVDECCRKPCSFAELKRYCKTIEEQQKEKQKQLQQQQVL